jgi:hypothetical protein
MCNKLALAKNNSGTQKKNGLITIKKKLIITTLLALLGALLLISSCQNKQGTCTEEAKLCPDGSSVARDPGNNCEFTPCQEIKAAKCSDTVFMCPDGRIVYQDPLDNCEFAPCNKPGEVKNLEHSRLHTERDTAVCKTLMFLCVEGAIPFYDETGCGCESINPRKYVSASLEECKTIRFACEEGTIHFMSELGCGCEFDWQSAGAPEYITENYCDPSNRPKFCTMEFDPVCGWFAPNIQCLQYPCAANFGNACSACVDKNVAYWTAGKCPPNDEIRE